MEISLVCTRAATRGRGLVRPGRDLGARAHRCGASLTKLTNNRVRVSVIVSTITINY